MKPPRGLSEEEAAAWAQVAETVAPIRPVPAKGANLAVTSSTPPLREGSGAGPPKQIKPPKAAPQPARNRGTPPPNLPSPGRGLSASRPRSGGGLDSHWDRRLKAGDIAPDVSLDLHGHGLDTAYTRLLDGMAQARSMGARTVLVVTGKPRPADPADRGTKRGAIRAKILDWLAASEHGSAIAAVRKAHLRHGGEGALYIVLRRGG